MTVFICSSGSVPSLSLGHCLSWMWDLHDPSFLRGLLAANSSSLIISLFCLTSLSIELDLCCTCTVSDLSTYSLISFDFLKGLKELQGGDSKEVSSNPREVIQR